MGRTHALTGAQCHWEATLLRRHLPSGRDTADEFRGGQQPTRTERNPGEAQPCEKVRVFGPMEVHPGYVQDLLGLMRRAGIIKEYLVADGRAPSPSVPLFDEDADEVADYLGRQVTSATVDLDPQEFQPVDVEVL
jgi:hypothetical protein